MTSFENLYVVHTLSGRVRMSALRSRWDLLDSVKKAVQKRRKALYKSLKNSYYDCKCQNTEIQTVDGNNRKRGVKT